MVPVYVLDALKESGVEPHVVGMLRQYGLYLLCQSIHLVVSLCRQQVEEHSTHAVQQVVVALLVVILVDDGIVEGRLRRVIDSLLYLLVVTSYALHEGLFIVLQTYTVEGRRVVRCPIGFKKRVYPFLYTFTHVSFTFSMQKYKKRFNYHL